MPVPRRGNDTGLLRSVAVTERVRPALLRQQVVVRITPFGRDVICLHAVWLKPISPFGLLPFTTLQDVQFSWPYRSSRVLIRAGLPEGSSSHDLLPGVATFVTMSRELHTSMAPKSP